MQSRAKNSLLALSGMAIFKDAIMIKTAVGSRRAGDGDLSQRPQCTERSGARREGLERAIGKTITDVRAPISDASAGQFIVSRFSSIM